MYSQTKFIFIFNFILKSLFKNPIKFGNSPLEGWRSRGGGHYRFIINKLVNNAKKRKLKFQLYNLNCIKIKTIEL